MAHDDDTGNPKWAVVGWINDVYSPSNPPLRVKSKVERGLENDLIGVLC